MTAKTGKDPSKADLEKSLSIHLLSILAQSKEREDGKSDTNLDPSIEDDGTASGDEFNLIPIRSMDCIPTVWKQRHDIPV